MARQPVNLVVGGHDALHPGAAAGCGGRQMNFAQFAFADPRSAGVDTAGSLALRAEMFGDHGDAFFLAAGHGGLRHMGAQEWIFTETFLAAPPARIAQNVENGNKRQAYAHGLHLAGADRKRIPYQIRLKRCAHGEGGWKEVPSQRLMSVRAFAAHQCGNTKLGMGDDIMLHRVAGLRRHAGRNSVFPRTPRPRISPVKTVQDAEPAPLFHLAAEFVRQLDLLPTASVTGKPIQMLVQLADFFPDRHAGEKVLRTLLRGKTRILIIHGSGTTRNVLIS